MMTLNNLKERMNERIKTVFEQAIENPSMKWFERMEYLLQGGSFVPKKLATGFLGIYKKEILGGMDNNNLLNILGCTKDDVIALGKELLSPENEDKIIYYIEEDTVQRYFNRYMEEGKYGDMLSDILFFIGYNTSGIIPSQDTGFLNLIYSLIENNLDRVYNSYYKKKEEVEKELADEMDNDYDEGFDELEESAKRHRKRLRF